jgi:hypothetical protein
VIEISKQQHGLRCTDLNIIRKMKKQGNMTPLKVNNSTVTNTNVGEGGEISDK